MNQLTLLETIEASEAAEAGEYYAFDDEVFYSREKAEAAELAEHEELCELEKAEAEIQRVALEYLAVMASYQPENLRLGKEQGFFLLDFPIPPRFGDYILAVVHNPNSGETRIKKYLLYAEMDGFIVGESVPFYEDIANLARLYIPRGTGIYLI